MDKEFCLLDEPWIKVLDKDANTKEVSLLELFKNAHLYKQLAGEIATQDAAILRVLLAIVITVFYRYNAEGEEDNILDYENPEDEVLYRWEEYWNKGEFDYKVFEKYLETYRERFYLFHPETPFWQVPDLKYGTDYNTISLFGNVKESNNVATRHHFSVSDGKYIDQIDYSEVARWLVYLNGYSVNVKTSVNGKSIPVGVGRLGQVGLLFVKENTIFKMLLINACMLKNGTEVWNEPSPIWENKVRELAGVRINPPNNLPELFTIQSRRIVLKRDENRMVIGIKMIGGDYYEIVNDPVEQMSLIRQKEDPKNKDNIIVVPHKHSKSISAWREFPTIVSDNIKMQSGLVLWIKTLKENELYNGNKMITFNTVGLEYGDGMSYIYGEIVNDNLSLSYDLINNVNLVWQKRITDQINKCERVAKESYYNFSKSLSEILYDGNSDKTRNIKNKLETQYFFLIDSEFRNWLMSINVKDSLIEQKEMEWEIKSKRIATKVVEEYINSLNNRSLMMAGKALIICNYSEPTKQR